MIKRIRDFLAHGVWLKQRTDLSGRWWWAVSQLRVVILTAKGFARHDTAMRSAALSFFTVMSLVPVLALVFVIFKGFGMEAAFSGYLYDLLPNQTAAVDQVVTFIGNLLERTRSGIMAVSAFFVLIWAVIQVFGNVEGAFNKIWEVKRSRSFARRFSTYMALVILVPILLLAANSVYVGMRTSVEIFTGSVVAEILFGAASVVIVILMFSIVYFVLPNTDVKFRNALKAGVVAGIGFSLFQVVYVFIQGNLSSYNAIYGTFAAVPLFLIWMQTSWQILLFGGELSFAMQNVRDFESERQQTAVGYDDRCKIMVAVMAIVVRNYVDGRGPTTPEQIAAEMGLPVRMVRNVAGELEDNELLLMVRGDKNSKSDAMAPGRDPHTIRLFDVIDAVSSNGDEVPELRATPLLERIDDIYEKARGGVLSSEGNVLLTDLVATK
ncbi:MAG: YihY family inner membrane protein [Alistipes sp.]|jgi:membrane protein|nr:YihY family inner membrane protein [Alistipes sp.]